jgi:hypothetical protein
MNMLNTLGVNTNQPTWVQMPMSGGTFVTLGYPVGGAPRAGVGNTQPGGFTPTVLPGFSLLNNNNTMRAFPFNPYASYGPSPTFFPPFPPTGINNGLSNLAGSLGGIPFDNNFGSNTFSNNIPGFPGNVNSNLLNNPVNPVFPTILPIGANNLQTQLNGNAPLGNIFSGPDNGLNVGPTPGFYGPGGPLANQLPSGTLTPFALAPNNLNLFNGAGQNPLGGLPNLNAPPPGTLISEWMNNPIGSGLPNNTSRFASGDSPISRNFINWALGRPGAIDNFNNQTILSMDNLGLFNGHADGIYVDPFSAAVIPAGADPSTANLLTATYRAIRGFTENPVSDGNPTSAQIQQGVALLLGSGRISQSAAQIYLQQASLGPDARRVVGQLVGRQLQGATGSNQAISNLGLGGALGASNLGSSGGLGNLGGLGNIGGLNNLGIGTQPGLGL